MSRNKKPVAHHWWPVGLQKYWADRRDVLSWIEPDGNVDGKKPANRQIAHKRHGHTIFRGGAWETNFESDFDIDNEVHNVVAGVRALKPYGWTPSEFFALIKLRMKKERSLKDMCKFHQLDEQLHRNLLLLLYSLLIRSPANRSRSEGYAGIAGQPPNEDVGKANMLQRYRIARELCMTGHLTNQYFVLLYSPLKKFTFGDGCLDWLTDSLSANRINGRALLPLTPNLCIYFRTPQAMRTSPNCASFIAAPWMVGWVNEITQAYSKNRLFFQGKPPKLTEAFRQDEYLEHKEKSDALISMLDEIVANDDSNSPVHFPK